MPLSEGSHLGVDVCVRYCMLLFSSKRNSKQARHLRSLLSLHKRVSNCKTIKDGAERDQPAVMIEIDFAALKVVITSDVLQSDLTLHVSLRKF